jgi:DNA-directed RNA polymerase subunit RPC12/RpoP
MHYEQCIKCSAPLLYPLEQDKGDMILRCIICGAKNIVKASVQIVGWRE